MTDDRVREDIAFIRAAIEQGRGYAMLCGPDLIVWGIAIAIGHLGSYAFIRGWSGLAPGWLWLACVGLAWLYSLRRPLQRLLRRLPGEQLFCRPSPMVMALPMLWLGCGICLTTLAIAATWTGDIRFGWFDAVVAGVLGAAIFTTAWLVDLPWLRWVAFAWWLGELAVYGLRHRPEARLLSAALMLLLLAGPGLVLVIRRARSSA